MLRNPAVGRNSAGKVEVHCEELRGQLPPWTILIGEKGPHYRPSPMHDGHLRPGKCAHPAVSPCVCKRSEVKSTTDPGSAPELTGRLSDAVASRAQRPISVLWHHGTMGPTGSFPATINKPSTDISGNFHQVQPSLKVTGETQCWPCPQPQRWIETKKAIFVLNSH